MNCKPSDIAYTVYHGTSSHGRRNAGRLVEVIQFVGRHRYSDGNIGRDTWRVKVLGGPLVDSQGVEWVGEVYIDDRFLRPIRPGDISDEEVRDLYSPEKETA